jgi:hypothetical protein
MIVEPGGAALGSGVTVLGKGVEYVPGGIVRVGRVSAGNAVEGSVVEGKVVDGIAPDGNVPAG